MAAGLAMTVSYAAVIIVIMIIIGCIEIIKLEEKIAKEQRHGSGMEWETDDGIAWLTVVSDKRRGKKTATLKGTSYSLSQSERIGSGDKADTVIDHPAVARLHAMLTYKKPGRILVKKIRNAAVSTNRKEGELMDGDRLIFGSGENCIELQLNFVNHSDIMAAQADSGEAHRGKRMPRR